MKQKLSIMVLVTIVAATAGFIGYSSSSGEVNTISSTPLATNALLSGHLTLELRDSNGNLKAIRETDNVVTRDGMNCVSRAIFGAALGVGSVGTNVCIGALTAPFTVIALGTTNTAETSADKVLAAETSAAGLAASRGTVVFTNSTGLSGGVGSAAKVVITKAFTNTSGGTVNVVEAGLFNDTAASTNGMFARKTFTSIAVANSDQLTVAWTIQMGNTTSFLPQ